MYTLALAFVIAVCIGSSTADKGMCTGCPEDMDPNDPELMTELKGALAEANVKETPLRITKAQTQVVAGIKIIVDFVTESNKECHASWVNQPWVSKQPQYVTINCA